MNQSLNYKFKKNCEIDNIEFKEGDIVAPDQGIVYDSFTMETTEELPTVTISKANKSNIEKVAVTSEAQKPADGLSDPKPIDLKKLKKPQLQDIAKGLNIEFKEEDTVNFLIEKIEEAQKPADGSANQ